MKKFLSIVLALGLILGMLPVFGAETTVENPYDKGLESATAGQKLKHYGLMDGNENGDLMEGRAMSRAEFAKVICVVMGKKAEGSAFAGPTGFADEDAIADWAKPWAGYVKTQGWMVGNENGEFMPEAIVDGKMLATVLLRALGYVDEAANDYENNIQELATLTELNPIKDGELLRGEAFDAIWPHITLPVAKDGKTVMKDVIGKDAPAPAKLEVVSIEANTLDKVVVTFNQNVKEIKNLAILDKFGNEVPQTKDIKDNKLIIEFDPGDIILKNQVDYTLLIGSATSEKGAVIENYQQVFHVFDRELPLVESVEFMGPRHLLITFNEGLEDRDGKLEVWRKSDEYKSITAKMSIEYNVAIVEFLEDFKDGQEYVIRISDFYDLAGHYNVVDNIEKVYNIDKTAPTAELSHVDQNGFTVTFSKPVTGVTVSNFAHSYADHKPVLVTSKKVAISDTDLVRRVRVTFWQTDGDYWPLPEGRVKVLIFGNNNRGGYIKDLWGNRLEDAIEYVDVVADLKNPSVVDVFPVSGSPYPALRVKFSRPVLFTAANIDVTDKETGEHILRSVNFIKPRDGYQVELNKDMENKWVHVKIVNVTDSTVNKNLLLPLYEQDIFIGDVTPPQIVNMTYQCTDRKDRSPATFILWFDDQLASTAANRDNFMFHLDKNADGVYEKTRFDGTIELGPKGKSIVFTTKDPDLKQYFFDAGNVPSIALRRLDINEVRNISNLAYRGIIPFTAAELQPFEYYFVNFKVVSVNKNLMKLRFDDEVLDFKASDILTLDIAQNGQPATSWKDKVEVLNTSGYEIVLRVKDADRFYPDLNVTDLQIKSNVKTATKRTVQSHASFPVVDEYRPEILSIKMDEATSVITVKFSEAVKLINGKNENDIAGKMKVSYAADNGSGLTEYKNTALGIGYTINVSGTDEVKIGLVNLGRKPAHAGEYIDITIAKDAFNVISDLNENPLVPTLEEPWTYKDPSSGTGLVARPISVEVTNWTTVDTVKIKFSDPISTAKIAEFENAIKETSVARYDDKNANTANIPLNDKVNAVAISGTDTIVLTLAGMPTDFKAGDSLEFNVPAYEDANGKATVAGKVKATKLGVNLDATTPYTFDWNTGELTVKFEGTENVYFNGDMTALQNLIKTSTKFYDNDANKEVAINADMFVSVDDICGVGKPANTFKVKFDTSKFDDGDKIIVNIPYEKFLDSNNRKVSVNVGAWYTDPKAPTTEFVSVSTTYAGTTANTFTFEYSAYIDSTIDKAKLAGSNEFKYTVYKFDNTPDAGKQDITIDTGDISTVTVSGKKLEVGFSSAIDLDGNSRYIVFEMPTLKDANGNPISVNAPIKTNATDSVVLNNVAPIPVTNWTANPVIKYTFSDTVTTFKDATALKTEVNKACTVDGAEVADLVSSVDDIKTSAAAKVGVTLDLSKIARGKEVIVNLPYNLITDNTSDNAPVSVADDKKNLSIGARPYNTQDGVASMTWSTDPSSQATLVITFKEDIKWADGKTAQNLLDSIEGKYTLNGQQDPEISNIESEVVVGDITISAKTLTIKFTAGEMQATSGDKLEISFDLSTIVTDSDGSVLDPELSNSFILTK